MYRNIILGTLLAQSQTFASALTHQPRDASASNVSTIHIPLNYYYGGNNKISTAVVLPFQNETIQVVYDQGSENFWMFGPNSTMNWGCTSLLCQGQCNTTVQDYDDWTIAPTAHDPEDFSFWLGYGGYTKVVQGGMSINQTLEFTNVAGQQSFVSNSRIALANYMNQRFAADDNCTNIGVYDVSIMGIAPFQQSADWNTTGPSMRQDALDRGAIGAATQSMWFDEAPEDPLGTFTGGGLWGGIDTSKFTGPLVKVPVKRNWLGSPSVGYYVPPPTVSVNGQIFNSSQLLSENATCLLDSGNQGDELPVNYDIQDAFFNATGIVVSPEGYVSWPGECDTIPSNLTVELTFDGVDSSESVTIKVPIKSYARSSSAEPGYCLLEISAGGCTLGGPFVTAAFFAADDERGEIALAQGGISARGSGPDESCIVQRIP